MATAPQIEPSPEDTTAQAEAVAAPKQPGRPTIGAGSRAWVWPTAEAPRPRQRISRRVLRRRRMVRFAAAAIATVFLALLGLVVRDQLTAPAPDTSVPVVSLTKNAARATPDQFIVTFVQPQSDAGTPAAGDVVANIAQARALLARNGANAVVWGQMVPLHGSDAMQLFWTTGQGPDLMRHDVPDDTVALPPLPKEDANRLFDLLAAARFASISQEKTGTYRAALLTPAIEAVRQLLRDREKSWDPPTLAAVHLIFADVLQDYGDKSRNQDALQESIALYRDALTQLPRTSLPQEWARAQNNLGTALVTLGEQLQAPDYVVQAIAAYRLALGERSRERFPLQWAVTQSNIGDAYRDLSQTERDTGKLLAAIQAYHNALDARTRESRPLAWAMTQNNLGVALQMLALRDSTAMQLQDAAAAYRLALAERTRERTPQQWTDTQYNLATVLEAMGAQDTGTIKLREAADTYQQILTQWTRERNPLAWARTEYRLGSVQSALGNREHDTAWLRGALAAFRLALQEFSRDKTPVEWSQTQNSIGDVLTAMAEREAQPNLLKQAIDAYQQALLTRTRAETPFDWAISTGRQGIARMLLSGRLHDKTEAKQAVTQLEGAVDALRKLGNATAYTYYQVQLNKARDQVKLLATQ